MDPRAPRLATASLVFGLLASVTAVASAALNLGLADGFSTEEIALTVVSVVLFLVSFFASRERPQMEMIASLSMAEQVAAMESLPTQFRSTVTDVDSLGFETTRSEPAQSQAIIASILGDSNDSTTGNVSDAFATLGSADGSVGAQHVQMNPAPHRHTQQDREVFQSSRSTQDTFERIQVQNIPLPGQEATPASEELPWLSPSSGFETDGIAQVPLPIPSSQPTQQERAPEQVETPLPVVSTVADVPSMPNLDDLFDSPESATPTNTPSIPQLPELPVLPNLDDLF